MRNACASTPGPAETTGTAAETTPTAAETTTTAAETTRGPAETTRGRSEATGSATVGERPRRTTGVPTKRFINNCGPPRRISSAQRCANATRLPIEIGMVFTGDRAPWSPKLERQTHEIISSETFLVFGCHHMWCRLISCLADPYVISSMCLGLDGWLHQILGVVSVGLDRLGAYWVVFNSVWFVGFALGCVGSTWSGVPPSRFAPSVSYTKRGLISLNLNCRGWVDVMWVWAGCRVSVAARRFGCWLDGWPLLLRTPGEA